MTTIVWNPKTMSTGVPKVDAQHQEWIRRYNLFDDAITQGKALDVVQSTLDFFVEYADFHFDFEESVMEERHCSAAAANKADHEHMRNILRGFNKYVKKHGFSVSEVISLKIEMEEWVVKHILTIDVQLRDS
jgi:hemerythrin